MVKMKFALWTLVAVFILFLLSHLNQSSKKNSFLKLLKDEDKFSLEYIYNWLSYLKKFEQERIKKGEKLFFLTDEDEWIFSRLWNAWFIKTENYRKQILVAKIYFGTNLKTPAENALESFDHSIKNLMNMDAEINYWSELIIKSLKSENSEHVMTDYDWESISKAYQPEKVQEFSRRIKEICKQDLEDLKSSARK